MFEKIKSVDWTDVGLHVAAAFGLMTILMAFGVEPASAAFAVTAAGYIREGYQAIKKGNSWKPTTWSFHKHMEAAAFPVAAFAMVLV